VLREEEAIEGMSLMILIYEECEYIDKITN
jgi:hypothetical protein